MKCSCDFKRTRGGNVQMLSYARPDVKCQLNFPTLNYKCSFCSSVDTSIRFACKLILILLLKSIAPKTVTRFVQCLHLIYYDLHVWSCIECVQSVYSVCYALANETKVSIYMYINHIRNWISLEHLTSLIVENKNKVENL